MSKFTTVSELIELLKEFDEDLPVLVNGSTGRIPEFYAAWEVFLDSVTPVDVEPEDEVESVAICVNVYG